jgi:hypothetical protein
LLQTFFLYANQAAHIRRGLSAGQLWPALSLAFAASRGITSSRRWKRRVPMRAEGGKVEPGARLKRSPVRRGDTAYAACVRELPDNWFPSNGRDRYD